MINETNNTMTNLKTGSQKDYYFNPTTMIHEALANAAEQGKFRTFAKIYRSSIDECFSSELLRGGYGSGMSFEEMGSVSVGSQNYGYMDESKIIEFRIDAIKRSFITEETGVVYR